MGVSISGLGMRSGGCGCEMRGARGVERRLHLPTARGVVDLPPSVREELHDGVDGSMPPSRHVGSNHDPCQSLNRQGGFAGGCDSRRSGRNPEPGARGRARKLRVERDVRGSAGCAWAEPFAKLVERVGQTTLVRGRRHNAIDPGITESTFEATQKTCELRRGSGRTQPPIAGRPHGYSGYPPRSL